MDLSNLSMCRYDSSLRPSNRLSWRVVRRALLLLAGAASAQTPAPAVRDEGTTVLIVDQMASMTLGVADRAYVLQQGTVVRSGAAAEIAGDAALEAAYLGGGPEAVEDAEKAEAP